MEETELPVMLQMMLTAASFRRPSHGSLGVTADGSRVQEGFVALRVDATLWYSWARCVFSGAGE